MKAFLGCEESGVGRRALQERGHWAVSCDLQPSRDNSLFHLRGDVVAHLESVADGYYDLGIFHPECTTVCVAGNRTHAGTKGRQDAVEWIAALWELAKRKCKRVAFENPASVIFPVLRAMGADVQYVQPYEHGHLEQKKTGFALHNLPRLAPTNNVYDEMMKLPRAKRERIHFMGPSATRTRDRSESYTGILAAAADQWGSL